jgi:hypothetical protein
MNDAGTGRRRDGGLTVGRLVEHGPANYQFRASESPSYFVRVVNLRGEQVLWGKDLERAIKEAQTKPKIGDQIGARRIGRERVTLTDRRLDSEGRVISQSEKLASRSQWVVEKVKFFADRQRLARRLRDSQLEARDAVREHPELKSTFLSIQAAQAFASQNIKNPADRDRFMAQLRAVMAASIQKGEPLPEIRMRDREPITDRPTDRQQSERGEPTR